MQLDDISVKVAEIDARSKSNVHRIDRLEQRQDETDKLVTSVQLLAQRMGTVEGDVSEIKSTVTELASKPAKRWDGLVEKIIWLVAGGIIAYVAASIGLPL